MFLETILREKKREVATMLPEKAKKKRPTYAIYDFLKTHSENLQVIAEVKKASPSLGAINLSVDVVKQAKAYEEAGAMMISVLTDSVFFKGKIEDLAEIAQNVSIPILNKDFIIDKKQIVRAVNAGASVILLIVAALSDLKLRELYEEAMNLGLEVLVETHNLEELNRAHQLGAKLIGINNRNLKTFEVDLKNSMDLRPYLKKENFYISESGIFGPEEAEQVKKDFSAVLVGTALMKSKQVSKALEDLKVKRI